MARETELENLTRELLNYEKLRLISVILKMAESTTIAEVCRITEKEQEEWGKKENRLHSKLTMQAVYKGMKDSER